MSKLLGYFRGYVKVTILAPLFKMFEAIFELLVPIIMASIIDVGIKNSDKPHIYKMCGLLVLLGAAGLFFALTAQYFAAKSAVGFATGLRSSLYKKLQTLSFSDIDTLGTSSMITRMTSDVNQIQAGVNMTLRLFLRSPFIVFGAVIMAFTIDFKSALIFVVTVVILFAVVITLTLVCIPLYRRVQSRLDRITRRIRENLSGVRVIRAFCMEESEKSEFFSENEGYAKMQLFVGRISALTNPVTFVIINLGVVYLVYSGAIGVDAGLISTGAVVALYNYMSQILVELIKFTNCIITMNKSLACASRVSKVFEITPTLERIPEQPTEKGEMHIRFENVSLTYGGSGEESLSNINLDIRRGETVGIIGGTGAGKTSLVNLIPHFYDATSGRVTVDGADVKSYEPDELRRKIGIVMQRAVLFKGSIRDNMLMGNADATDDEIMAALKTAQAEEVVRALPHGLDSEVEPGGGNFSGGQRQRLTIARALVRRPEILILDDSASALDYATDLKLRKSIAALDYNPTVIIVSQRTASVMNADKIVVMDDGAVSAIGKHDELLENCEIYAEIYNSQFKKGDEKPV